MMMKLRMMSSCHTGAISTPGIISGDGRRVGCCLSQSASMKMYSSPNGS